MDDPKKRLEKSPRSRRVSDAPMSQQAGFDADDVIFTPVAETLNIGKRKLFWPDGMIPHRPPKLGPYQELLQAELKRRLKGQTMEPKPQRTVQLVRDMLSLVGWSEDDINDRTIRRNVVDPAHRELWPKKPKR